MKNTQQILLSSFSDAFIKLMKCTVDDLIIESIEDGKAVKIIYQEQAYQVCTWNWLYEEVMDMITDPDGAQYIHLYIWLKATQEGSLNTSEFYLNLVDMLEDIEQASLLSITLSISSFVKDMEEVFWHSLKKLDRTGILFGKAIVASAKTFNTEMLAEEILHLRLENGIKEYNQLEEGLFKAVSIELNEEEDVEFYIFTCVE